MKGLKPPIDRPVIALLSLSGSFGTPVNKGIRSFITTSEKALNMAPERKGPTGLLSRDDGTAIIHNNQHLLGLTLGNQIIENQIHFS